MRLRMVHATTSSLHAISVAGIERGKVFLHVWRKSQLSPG
jgi:hypothetical protein